jgi:hypothetical protein
VRGRIKKTIVAQQQKAFCLSLLHRDQHS